MNYAPFVLLGLGLAAGLVLLYPRAAPPLRRRPWPQAAATALGIVALAVVATRGGLQKKPLRPIHAFAQGEHELGVLALNSIFTLIRSPRDRQVEPVAFFASDTEAAARLRAPFGVTERPAERQNIGTTRAWTSADRTSTWWKRSAPVRSARASARLVSAPVERSSTTSTS